MRACGLTAWQELCYVLGRRGKRRKLVINMSKTPDPLEYYRLVERQRYMVRCD